jgi:hypothetical protein
MKRLIQLNLLLLLISSATAQDSQPQETTPQQPSKTLRVYDWKDLAQQHQLSGGEVISMDGMSVLKIENTNNTPLEISLLKVADPSVIKKAYFFLCEIKYENVSSVLNEHTHDLTFIPGSFSSGSLKLLGHLPPAALGGDGITIEQSGMRGKWGVIAGTSNWRPCQFLVVRNASEGLPTQLELKLSLPGSGIVYLRPIKLLGVVSSWWPAQQGGMVGGAVGIFGGIIGCFGGLLGCLAGFGKARKFVLMTTKIFIALGMFLAITGIVAILCKQPYFVWYVFLLPGVILTLVFSLNFPLIQRRYDDLEIRRMASIDAMGS